MLSRGRSIISIAATIAVLFFFLPWFLVSCEGQPLGEASAWQLASGTQFDAGGGTYNASAPELFIVLLAGVGCLVAIYLVYQRRISVRRAASIVLGLAALSLLVAFYEIADVRATLGDYGLQVKLRLGIWGTMLGNVAAIAGAVMDLREEATLEGEGTPSAPAVSTRL